MIFANVLSLRRWAIASCQRSCGVRSLNHIAASRTSEGAPAPAAVQRLGAIPRPALTTLLAVGQCCMTAALLRSHDEQEHEGEHGEDHGLANVGHGYRHGSTL